MHEMTPLDVAAYFANIATYKQLLGHGARATETTLALCCGHDVNKPMKGENVLFAHTVHSTRI